MRTLSTWLLGGALAASLTWNWTLAREREPAAPAGCGDVAKCSLASADLGLEPELEGKLAELCARSCGESDRLERSANELQRELLAGLSADQVDEAATSKLVDEVSELRRRSLASCVAGILGVRKVLSSEQVRSLLARCEHGPASCR